MIRTMAIAGALGLAACAGTSKQAKEDPEQSQLICTWERSVGSNIPEKVCREPEDQPDPAQGSVQPGTSGQSTK